MGNCVSQKRKASLNRDYSKNKSTLETQFKTTPGSLAKSEDRRVSQINLRQTNYGMEVQKDNEQNKFLLEQNDINKDLNFSNFEYDQRFANKPGSNLQSFRDRKISNDEALLMQHQQRLDKRNLKNVRKIRNISQSNSSGRATKQYSINTLREIF